MHRKQDSDLIPADTEMERILRSLRKTKRAENAAMQMRDMTKQRNRGQQPEGPPLLTQWRISGGLLLRKNILQSDSLLWMQIILN